MNSPTTHALLDVPALTPEEHQDVALLFLVMARLLVAGRELGVLTVEQVRSWGRCLLASTAMVDVFHAIGRTDVALYRAGCIMTMSRAGQFVDMVAIGHPHAPHAPHLWNGHMMVLLRHLLADPTHGQLKQPWNWVPDCAVFKKHEGRGPEFHLYGYGPVEEIASAIRTSGDRVFETRLFRLPREVDLTTRKWRERPDAQPQRRAALVARTLKLLEPDLEAGRLVPGRTAA